MTPALLWIGHWRTGYEVINPQQLQRIYQSTPEESGAPPADKKGKQAKSSNPAYVFTILTRAAGPPLIGWYGHGLTESAANVAGTLRVPSAPQKGAPLGEFGTADFGKPKPTDSQKLPSPAAPPTLDELNAMLAKLVQWFPHLKNILRPPSSQSPTTGRTQGDWLGRYGRYWACCCAICSPEDYIWGAGPEAVQYVAQIGPHATADDTVRYWIHWLATSERRSLEMPPTYLDSRVRKGYNTPDKNRRQAEWDDLWRSICGNTTIWVRISSIVSLAVPSGQFYLSLYDFNKDGHEGDNDLRDYKVSIRRVPENADLKVRDAFERLPEVAAGRIHNFWGGVWTRFYLQGPQMRSAVPAEAPVQRIRFLRA